ncbi:SCO family protein [Noviherbaspirillum sedimenti]|uniref:SCO family protein n=1 Tax=Noviherbaspirillum sedimenti TaxID=2320865 RepID=UPI0018F78E01|nr:SCO family protein [Noviherbaspirillum sedimenti]
MNGTILRTCVATLLVAAAALAAFYWVTAGFSAVSADGVRRAHLAQAPRALPDLALIDQRGEPLALSDYGAPRQKATFVALVYVQCQTVCRTSASGQAWLQHAIRARGLQERVQLLTLSFDPRNDSPAVLDAYARKLGADSALWKFATVRDAADLPALLGLFDIVVLPDGLGGYSHNAALFLVDGNGRLARAYDIDRPDLALADFLQQQGG